MRFFCFVFFNVKFPLVPFVPLLPPDSKKDMLFPVLVGPQSRCPYVKMNLSCFPLETLLALKRTNLNAAELLHFARHMLKEFAGSVNYFGLVSLNV